MAAIDPPPDISVVTPSYNMRAYLARCVRSVADQKDVRVEHVVIDGASSDGSVEWLQGEAHVRTISEADRGMYDALNKGLCLATGSVVGHLNCDEQYLPGTLSFVKRYFAEHPDVDILFGSSLLIRPDGNLLAFRKAYAPRQSFIWTSHLYLLTCATFFRRRLIDDGLRFDAGLRCVADHAFVLDALRRGYRASYTQRYMSAFTMTNANLGATETAARELRELTGRAPRWMQTCRLPLQLARLASKALSGAYFQPMPLEYAVYVDERSLARTQFHSARASFRWTTSG